MVEEPDPDLSPEERIERYRAVVEHHDRMLRALQQQLEEERRTFPVPGIWLVQEDESMRRQERIARVADLPEAVPLAALHRRKDAIVRAVDALRREIQGTARRERDGGISWSYPSANHVAGLILHYLASAEEGGE